MPKKMAYEHYLLKNKFVLYFIFLIALGNISSLTFRGEWFYATLFLLVGFLTAFFSKNMIVILCTALVVTNVLMFRPSQLRIRDGFESGSMTSQDSKTKDSTETKIKDPVEAKEKLEELLNNNKHVDEETKKNIYDLLDTQLKLVTGVTEMKPLLEQTVQIMESLKKKTESA